MSSRYDVGYVLCEMAENPRHTLRTKRRKDVAQLGRNVRRLRIAAGLTQTALAKRSGMDRSYVSGLEAGQRNPTALTLQRLAKVLRVTPVVFFQ
jgi:DNA-binding XRE family transcriptional regulator